MDEPFDPRTGLLFVAGLGTGQGYVYDTATGSTVAVEQFADPATGPVINDVTLTAMARGSPTARTRSCTSCPFHTAYLGRSAHWRSAARPARSTGHFSLNGIAATPDGKTLVVAHTGNASLYTVDPASGASATSRA